MSHNGENTLLGNQYIMVKEAGEIWNIPFEDRFVLKNYPLPEVFEKFYREEIRDYPDPCGAAGFAYSQRKRVL